MDVNNKRELNWNLCKKSLPLKILQREKPFTSTPQPRLRPSGFFLKFISSKEAVLLLGVPLPGTEERSDLVSPLRTREHGGVFFLFHLPARSLTPDLSVRSGRGQPLTYTCDKDTVSPRVGQHYPGPAMQNHREKRMMLILLLESCSATDVRGEADGQCFLPLPHLSRHPPQASIAFTRRILRLPNVFGGRLPPAFCGWTGCQICISLLATMSKLLTFWTDSTAVFKLL